MKLVLAVIVLVGAAALFELHRENQNLALKVANQTAELNQLSARLDASQKQEPPTKEHHYELRNDGSRTWRFDPETGETCLQLTTKSDWKNRETTRQGCQYQDYLSVVHSYDGAECLFFNDKNACNRVGIATGNPQAKETFTNVQPIGKYKPSDVQEVKSGDK